MWQTWKGRQEKAVTVAQCLHTRALGTHMIFVNVHHPTDYRLGPEFGLNEATTC